MPTIDLGRIQPINRGAYSNVFAYELLDIVTYLGGTYITKQATTGNLPTDATYWSLVAELNLADGSVTTAKLAAGAVTIAKTTGVAASGANSDITSLTALAVGGLPNGTVTPADLSQPLTAGTAVATTSGTSIDFTSIPSWVKRITVMLSGVSGSGTGDMSIRLGTVSGFEATGYATATWTSNTNNTNFTTGFFLRTAASATILSSGHFVFTLVGSNTWVGSGTIARTDAADMNITGGSKTLAGTLDRIQLVISSGTFDAGSMNILYEG